MHKLIENHRYENFSTTQTSTSEYTHFSNHYMVLVLNFPMPYRKTMAYALLILTHKYCTITQISMYTISNHQFIIHTEDQLLAS